MASFQAILYLAIAFNAVLVFLVLFFLRRSRNKQKNLAKLKRNQIIEQGKIISAQENLLKKKQDLLREKDDLLGEYRKYLD